MEGDDGRGRGRGRRVVELDRKGRKGGKDELLRTVVDSRKQMKHGRAVPVEEGEPGKIKGRTLLKLRMYTNLLSEQKKGRRKVRFRLRSQPKPAKEGRRAHSLIVPIRNLGSIWFGRHPTASSREIL